MLYFFVCSHPNTSYCKLRISNRHDFHFLFLFFCGRTDVGAHWDLNTFLSNLFFYAWCCSWGRRWLWNWKNFARLSYPRIRFRIFVLVNREIKYIKKEIFEREIPDIKAEFKIVWKLVLLGFSEFSLMYSSRLFCQ